MFSTPTQTHMHKHTRTHTWSLRRLWNSVQHIHDVSLFFTVQKRWRLVFRLQPLPPSPPPPPPPPPHPKHTRSHRPSSVTPCSPFPPPPFPDARMSAATAEGARHLRGKVVVRDVGGDLDQREPLPSGIAQEPVLQFFPHLLHHPQFQHPHWRPSCSIIHRHHIFCRQPLGILPPKIPGEFNLLPLLPLLRLPLSGSGVGRPEGAEPLADALHCAPLCRGSMGLELLHSTQSLVQLFLELPNDSSSGGTKNESSAQWRAARQRRGRGRDGGGGGCAGQCTLALGSLRQQSATRSASSTCPPVHVPWRQ